MVAGHYSRSQRTAAIFEEGEGVELEACREYNMALGKQDFVRPVHKMAATPSLLRRGSLDKPGKLASLFSIQPGEGQRTLLMVLYAFLGGMACTFFYTAAYALFLTQFHADKLPYVYIGAGLIVAAVGFVYAKLEAVLSASKLLSATVLLLLGSTLVFYLGLQYAPSKWLIFALIMWYDVLFSFVELGYWSLASQLFNVREGKRLFGLIGSGEQVAGALAGFSIPFIIGYVGTMNLLLVSVGSLLLCAVVLSVILGRFSDRLAVSEEQEEEGTDQSAARDGGGLLSLLRDRYCLMTILMMVLTLFAFYFLDLAFYDQAGSHCPAEQDLARFLGVFNGIVQIASLVVLALLSGRLLDRYGLRFGLLAVPVVVGGATLLLAGLGTAFGVAGLFFWMLVATKLSDGILRVSIGFPAIQLLYQPLPTDRRLSMHTVIETIATPVASVLAGGLLLALSAWAFFTTVPLLYVLLVMFAGLLVVSIVLCREYATALMEALSSRILGGPALSFGDATSMEVLRTRLGSPHPGEVVYCLNMLESVEHNALREFLVERLDHPSPEVRLFVLERLQDLRIGEALPEIRGCLEREDSPKVKAAALEAFCSLGEFGDIDHMSSYIDDPDPLVSRGAIVGFLRSGGVGQILVAGRRLLEMEHASDPSERQSAAEVLGRVGSSGFYSPLLTLLEDESPQVRIAALGAAGRVSHPKLWPLALDNLASSDCHREAASALAEGGDGVVPLLRSAFAQEGQSAEMLVRIARTCGKIGTPSAIDMLREHVRSADRDVRQQVLTSLRRCEYVAQGKEVEVVEQAIEAEMADATWSAGLLSALPNDEPSYPLRSALQVELEEARGRLFLLLSFVYDSESVLSARVKLDQGTGDQRAYALELLDTLLPQELKDQLLPLLEGTAVLIGRQRGEPASRRRAHECLGEILAPGDVAIKPWTRACALYAVARLSRGEMVDLVVSALSDPASAIRETAAWALAALSPEEYQARLGALREDPSASVQTIVEAIETKGTGDVKMLLTIEKVLVLKAVSIFSEIPDDVLAKVANVLKEATFEAGESIFKEGDVGDRMYIIVEGQVRIHDEERAIGELGPRDVFGEMAVLDAEPRSASATALTDCQLVHLSQHVFHELMGDHVAIVRGISRLLSRRLRQVVT